MGDANVPLLEDHLAVKVKTNEVKVYKPKEGYPNQVALQFPREDNITNIVIQFDGGSGFRTTFKEKNKYLFTIWGTTCVGLGFVKAHLTSPGYETVLMVSAISVVASFIIWLFLFWGHEVAKEDPCKIWAVRMVLQLCYSVGIFGLGAVFVGQFFLYDYYVWMCSCFGGLLLSAVVIVEVIHSRQIVKVWISWLWGGVRAFMSFLYNGVINGLTFLYDGVVAGGHWFRNLFTNQAAIAAVVSDATTAVDPVAIEGADSSAVEGGNPSVVIDM